MKATNIVILNGAQLSEESTHINPFELVSESLLFAEFFLDSEPSSDIMFVKYSLTK